MVLFLCCGVILGNLSWFSVWLPISCHCWLMCLTVSGNLLILVPTRKNVALTRFLFRMSSSLSVCIQGPSSKVKATQGTSLQFVIEESDIFLEKAWAGCDTRCPRFVCARGVRLICCAMPNNSAIMNRYIMITM